MQSTDLIPMLLALGSHVNESVTVPGGIPTAMVPNNCQVVSLEQFSHQPFRVRQQVKMIELASFLRYVTAFKRPNTLIFARLGDGMELVAVIDYHGSIVEGVPMPQWCQHTCTFQARPAWQWQAWMSVWAKPLKQAAFVEFIEQRVAEIKEPAGAAVLEIVENLSARFDAKWDNKLPIKDGKTVMNYEQVLTVSGGPVSSPGRIELPRELKVEVPVFEGSDPLPLVLRLRPSVENREVVFRIDSVFPPTVIQRTVSEQFLGIVEAKTGIKPLLGSHV